MGKSLEVHLRLDGNKSDHGLTLCLSHDCLEHAASGDAGPFSEELTDIDRTEVDAFHLDLVNAEGDAGGASLVDCGCVCAGGINSHGSIVPPTRISPMRCAYFVTGQCRSCPHIERPYADQLTDKQAVVERTLAAHIRPEQWHPIVASPTKYFRNKVKIAVGGTVAHPRLGFVGRDGTVTDIRICPIQDEQITAALPHLARFIALAGLTPYSVSERRGELKYLLVTAAPTGHLMVRFVLRSTESLPRIRKNLPTLQRWLPHLAVASANFLPEHKAVTEGAEETLLTSADALPLRLGDRTLYLPPRSFFQTNTMIAQALYATAANLVTGLPAGAHILDLYCGIGGFALHLTRPGRTVTGVEISAPAIAAATRAAAELPDDVDPPRFIAADAIQWMTTTPTTPAPTLTVVNPPRRGIGPVLAARLNEQPGAVIYSSCNPATLAADLDAMPGFRVTFAQAFDMFPHTEHVEVLTLLEPQMADSRSSEV